MRFLLIVKATEYSQAGLADGKDYREAMISYKKSLAKKGALFSDEELQPNLTGLRIMYPKKGGKPQLLAGPFPVNQDLIMEYMLINVSTECRFDPGHLYQLVEKRNRKKTSMIMLKSFFYVPYRHKSFIFVLRIVCLIGVL